MTKSVAITFISAVYLKLSLSIIRSHYHPNRLNSEMEWEVVKNSFENFIVPLNDIYFFFRSGSEDIRNKMKIFIKFRAFLWKKVAANHSNTMALKKKTRMAMFGAAAAKATWWSWSTSMMTDGRTDEWTDRQMDDINTQFQVTKYASMSEKWNYLSFVVLLKLFVIFKH